MNLSFRQCLGGPSDSFSSWEGERLYSFGLTHCFFSPQRPHQEISGHRPSPAARQHEGELVRLPVSLNHMAPYFIPLVGSLTSAVWGQGQDRKGLQCDWSYTWSQLVTNEGTLTEVSAELLRFFFFFTYSKMGVCGCLYCRSDLYKYFQSEQHTYIHTPLSNTVIEVF